MLTVQLVARVVPVAEHVVHELEVLGLDEVPVRRRASVQVERQSAPVAIAAWAAVVAGHEEAHVFDEGKAAHHLRAVGARPPPEHLLLLSIPPELGRRRTPRRVSENVRDGDPHVPRVHRSHVVVVLLQVQLVARGRVRPSRVVVAVVLVA